MQNRFIARSLLLAGVFAAAGAAQAQYYSGSAATTDTPQGEASTMTNGVPNMRTTNSPYPDGTPVVVLGSPYYGSYYYPGQVVTSPSYPYPRYVYSTTPVYPAVVATTPSYPAVVATSPYPSYPAVIARAPQNPAVVMPRQVVPGTTYYYYSR